MKLRKFNEHSDYLDKIKDFDNQISKIKDEKSETALEYKSKIRNCAQYIFDMLDIAHGGEDYAISLPNETETESFWLEFYINEINNRDVDNFIDVIERTISMLEYELNAEDFEVIIPIKHKGTIRKGTERGFKKHDVPNIKEIISNLYGEEYSFDEFYIEFK